MTTVLDTEPVAAARASRQVSAITGSRLFNRICTGVVLAIAVIWLVPLLWAVDTSFKPNSETANLPVTWWIEQPTLDSYASVLRAGDVWDWYASSAIIGVLTVVLTVLTASMAAFALSRMRFRRRGAVLGLVLAGLLIPSQVLIVPLFREMNALGLLNTYWAVILPQVPTAIAVFVFKQFLDGLPIELEEAARIDGAGWWRIYWTIALPLTRPAIAAVAIFTFVWSWNSLLWPLLVLSSPDVMTVPVGLATVQGNFGIRYADTMATSLLGGLPLVALFLFFQRQIVEGVAGTGLKG
ncbi:carbohydrate ABC transporter permease [Pseudonocardia sp. CA-107938]|uniref:carbohydrate ABC transporter permease n=1 Tax=Pseudonocardia sp. CA-107938 TaxID=3240021 RepID=UPI003D8E72AD